MYKTILVPIDLSHPEQGSKTLRIAGMIGGEGSRVIALYVAADVPGFVTVELPKGLLEKSLAKSRTDLEVLADEAAAEAMIETGHPSTKILECAEKTGADLIIVASHRPKLQDYFLGSTAARVVRHAQCAVFVDR